MTIRIDGTNTTANPGITGGDADTGLQFGTDEVKIVTGGSDRVTVDNSGNLSVAAGNLVLASGSGIDFSANANVTGMTSELLDDYEEGTFTVDNNGDATGIISGSYAKYIKIGNVVHIHFVISVSNAFTGSSLGGLPFPVANASGSPSSVHGVYPLRSSGSSYFFQINSGGTTMSTISGPGGGSTALVVSYSPYRFFASYLTS